MFDYSITQWLFGILSFMVIFFGLLVVFSKNPVHSVLYLVLTFFCIAGHYLLLNAQFLAIVHIAVYAGAIMVLFLFVIMLMNLNEESEPKRNNLGKFIGVVVGGLLLLVMVGVLKSSEQIQAVQATNSDAGLIKNLGHVLFSEFLFPFEIVSVLLLAALVGAIMIGKKDETNEKTESNTEKK